jgi:hypothetical protein
VRGGGDKGVAVVNQAHKSNNTSSAYEAFNTALLSSVVTVPLVQAFNPESLTGVQVQNAGTGAANDIVVAWQPNVAKLDVGREHCPNPIAASEAFDLSAGKSHTLLAGPAPGSEPQFNQLGGCTYIGSAIVTGPPGSKLAVVVNQSIPGYPDGLSSYVAG